MDESTAWTRSLRYQHVTGDVLAGMVRELRRILIHPDLSNAQKLAAAAALADQVAPPPGTGLPVTVAALLARGTGLATPLLEDLAGEPLRMTAGERSKRELTAAEAPPLEAEAGDLAWYRAGSLDGRYSGVTAARVTSLILPARLPRVIREALDATDAPFGKLVAPLGARREPLTAQAQEDGTVASCALVMLQDRPVAYATETVTAALCRAAAPSYGISKCTSA